MEQYINKSALVSEIESKIEKYTKRGEESDAKRDGYGMYWGGVLSCLNEVMTLCDTIEVKEVDNFLTPFISFKDMVNIQYPSVNDGIKAHAEIYSFNIESELFNQLTPEQQKLWRNDIEQAYISGGDAGVELARDHRYKENLEVK